MFQQVPPNYMAQASAEQKIHISNLHESITEEILWNSFKEFGQISKIKVFRNSTTQKSRGYAKMTFQQPQQAAKAIKDMNLKQLFESTIKQKSISVTKDISIEQLVTQKKHNIFIKGIPEDVLDHKIIFNYLTRFGDIHSLSVLTNKAMTKNAGIGSVQFVEAKDAEALIKKTQDGEDIQLEGSKLQFQKHEKPEKKSEYNNFYIRNFSESTFEGTEGQDHPLVLKEKEVLQVLLAKYGTIASLIISIDQGNKKPYAFCSYEEDARIQEFMQDYNAKKLGDNIYINKVNKKSSSSKYFSQENRFFNIKNLKHFETEEERKAFEAQCRKALEQFGKVTSFKMKVGEKPKDKQELKNSCNAILVFENEEQGNRFLMEHLESKQIASIFIDENPHANVTILLPKSERKRMIACQNKNIKQNQNQNFQQILTQQMQYSQQPQFNNRMGQMKPWNNKNQQQQPFNQSRGRGGNLNPYNNRQQQPQNNQQPQVIKSNGPKPAGQLPSTDKQAGGAQPERQSLENLKNNLEKFTTLEPSKQSQLLGNLIFPKVKKLVNEQNQPDSLAPKITGMLIDFSVFDVSEIIDILENDDDLKERVNEAIELIKQQQ